LAVVCAALLVLLGSIAGAAPASAQVSTGCGTDGATYGVGIALRPEFVGTDILASTAYPGEIIDYDVTVFLLNNPPVVVCSIELGTVTLFLPDGTGPYVVATNVAIQTGNSQTWENVPGTKYTINEAHAGLSVGGKLRVEARAHIDATSKGPDEIDPQDNSLVSADTGAPTFLLRPSSRITIAPSAAIVTPGTSVTWTVTETNDTPPQYFDVPYTSVSIDISADGGATVLQTLTGNFSGDTDTDGQLDTGEVWQWTFQTAPMDDQTLTATGHGIAPRNIDITFPLDPEERAQASVDVIRPSTKVGISANASVVNSGESVTWTVSETNDGDVPLSNPHVNLDADGGDNGDVATLAAPPNTGDVNANSLLDPGETWTWVRSTVAATDITVTATGHGLDPIGRDITPPLDPDERASTAVRVRRASTAVGIITARTQIAFGSPVEFTVTEANDGEVPLTSTRVDLTSEIGSTSTTITSFVAPPHAGDMNANSVLDPGETWSWTTNAGLGLGEVTLVATGHGIDPTGRDITYPGDPDERVIAKITVGPPDTLPPTGGGPNSRVHPLWTGVGLGFAGIVLVFAGRRRRRTV
jgi:hypothetical protein